MVKKNSIPERWRSLTAVGQRVPGSRFIAFKVPLKGATSQRVTQNQKFTPKDLLANIRSQNEELGLIIDLTNTERYYTTKDLPKSVQYVKLHTAGLKIPDDATIHQFKRVVRRFIFAHEDDDKIIGIHCTTGINRTGYLICRYLIDIEGWEPISAVSAFAQARGHPIEGAVYIEDLLKGPPRSNVGIDTPATDEERKALESTEEFPWERGQRSILEAANEFGDFDARGGGGRDGPGEFQDDFHRDPRAVRGPNQNILGDHDLRLQNDPQSRGYMDDGPRPMHPSGRFRRPGPHMEGRFDHGPRPLMDIQGGFGPRMMQRPYEGAEMGREDMDFDLRGRPNPPHSHEEYDDTYSHPPYARNKMPNPMYDEGEADEFPYHEDYPDEGPGYNSRAQEGMGDSFRGPPNKRMNPNARSMEGPMNNRMGPRDPRFMEEHVNDKRFPGNAQGRGGPPRNARLMGPPGGANAREGAYMEGPRNTQYIEESINDEADYTGNEGPANKRMHPNAGRQGFNKPMYNRMQGARAVDDSMNDQAYPGDSQTYNDPGMYPRNSKSFDGPLNNRGYQHAMGGAMSDQMYPQGMDGSMYSIDAQASEGSMNDWMHERGAMEGPGNERMHPRENKFAMNKPRPADGPMRQNFPSDARPYEGRNHNASEGPNRFAPYPPRKPMQTPQTMGPPGNDQHNMGHPARAYGDVSYPPRNRIN